MHPSYFERALILVLSSLWDIAPIFYPVIGSSVRIAFLTLLVVSTSKEDFKTRNGEIAKMISFLCIGIGFIAGRAFGSKGVQ